MTWYFYSIIAAFSAAWLITCFQKLQEKYPIDVYLFYIWISSALILGLYSLRFDFKISGVTALCLVAAGISSWLGNFAYNKSITKQFNLGYVETVSSIRLVIVYCTSFIWLNAEIEIIKLIALFGVVFGIFLVVGINNKPIKSSNNGWVAWSLISGIMFALLAIANRYANEYGLDPSQAIPIWLFIASLFYGSSSFVKRKSFRLMGNMKILFLAIVLAICHNLALFQAYKSAPNLAYPASINNSRLVILYIFSTFIGSSKVKFKKALGIVIVFLSIALLFNR